MNIYLTLSIIAFLISFGSYTQFEIKKKGEIILIQKSAIGSFIMFLIPLLSILMLNLTLNLLIELNWFLVLIVSIIIAPLLGNPLALIYSHILGFKTTKKINLRTLEADKKVNNHLIDAFITFGIGMILYFNT
jgi:hypothetical protein